MDSENKGSAEEAAWVIYGKGEQGRELWFFESHLTEDRDSPSGEGYYFAAWHCKPDGWDEYGGGLYWGYRSANELEEVIGESIPFTDYSYKSIPYADFEDICFSGDIAKEREYSLAGGIGCSKRESTMQSFDVTIAETLKRTVAVKANNAEEAQAKVEGGWKNEKHVLGADDFKEVHFTVNERQCDKGLSR